MFGSPSAVNAAVAEARRTQAWKRASGEAHNLDRALRAAEHWDAMLRADLQLAPPALQKLTAFRAAELKAAADAMEALKAALAELSA
jgi:hypothetical protein